MDIRAPRLINDPNEVIARAIQPKRKGWAWQHRTGQPIQFGEPTQITALVGWASHQPWWKLLASPAYSVYTGATYADVYRHMCDAVAERQVTVQQLAEVLRNMVASAISLHQQALTITEVLKEDDHVRKLIPD